MLKFIARGKWLPLSKSMEIMKEYHIAYSNMMQESFKEEYERVSELRERFKNSLMKKTDDLIVEMEEIILEDYESSRMTLENQISNQN